MTLNELIKFFEAIENGATPAIDIIEENQTK